MFEDNVKVEELLNKINEDIKKELSEKRYNHSVGVMKKAEELAKIHGVDVNKAKLVGLAHDIGKELSSDDKLKYCSEHGIFVDDIERQNTGLLHTKIGADICKRRYGFTQDMQDAIKYHATGNENMDTLAKVLMVADKVEDGRTYDDEAHRQRLQEGRRLAVENLDAALLYEIDASLVYTIKKGKLIHTDSILTRNKIISHFSLYFSQKV